MPWAHPPTCAAGLLGCIPAATAMSSAVARLLLGALVPVAPPPVRVPRGVGGAPPSESSSERYWLSCGRSASGTE